MSHLPVVISGKDPKNGFVNRTDSTLGMSGSNFQLTTASSFQFYSGGVLFTKSTTQAVAIATDLTLHYVYFDTAGTLQVSTSPWDITSDNVPAALVYKDGSTYVIWDERHHAERDRRWHNEQHKAVGMLHGSGLVGTFGNSSLSFTQGTVFDEDIEFDTGGTKTTCNIWYRNSGLTSMRVELNSSTPYKANAGVLQYDNAGTMANATTNRFVCQYAYGSANSTNPIQVVVGQAQYTTVAAAGSDPLPSILLSTADWKLLYRAIYQNVGGTATYIEAADYRKVATGLPTAPIASSHTALTDRDAVNSHPASAISGLPIEICVAASDETTDLTTGTAKVTFRTPCAITVTAVRASLTTAATGTTLLTVDINEAGSTILSTKITIDASEKTSTTAATPPVISDTALADDAEITVDIDAIGSTTAGKGLKVWIIGTRT